MINKEKKKEGLGEKRKGEGTRVSGHNDDDAERQKRLGY